MACQWRWARGRRRAFCAFLPCPFRLVRKCFTDASRKERKRPFSVNTGEIIFLQQRPKKFLVKSWHPASCGLAADEYINGSQYCGRAFPAHPGVRESLLPAAASTTLQWVGVKFAARREPCLVEDRCWSWRSLLQAFIRKSRRPSQSAA